MSFKVFDERSSAILRGRKISAVKVVSGTPTNSEREDDGVSLASAFDCAADPKHKIVYMTPEMAVKGIHVIAQFHRKHPVPLLAIDEAHCISEWGPDFRHSYRQLGSLRAALIGTPCVAVTATANARVQEDIIHSVGLDLHSVEGLFKGSFDRPRLKLSTVLVGQLHGHDCVVAIANTIDAGCSIVYCMACQEVDTLCKELQVHLNEMVAQYHGKMHADNKKRAHNSWASGKRVLLGAAGCAWTQLCLVTAISSYSPV